MSLRRRLLSRPGTRPGTFGQRRGFPPGALHQGIELLNPLISVGDQNSEDRWGWPVDDLAAHIAFDYADGDGLAPFVGPALTAAGTVNQGVATPWVLPDGTPVTCTEFDNGGLFSATAVDPALATDDWVVIHLSRHTGQGGTEFVAATRAGAGSLGLWQYYTTAGGNRNRVTIDGDLADVFPLVNDVLGGWHLVVSRGDKSANHYLYVNSGVPGDTDNIVGVGDIRGANGIGIGCLPTGGATSEVCVARVLFYYGAGIADIATNAWVDNLMRSVLGSAASQGTDGDPVRVTAGSWQSTGGIWHIAGMSMERAGDADGYRFSPARTNQAFKNRNVVAGDAAAALTATAGVTSEVDDSVALAAAGAHEWGPNVYQFANATGAPQYVRMSQQTGDVNARSLQCLIRRSAGAGAVNLGLYDESAGTFVTGAAINDGYGTRTLVHGQVPADVDCTLCLEVADNTTVRFVAQDMSTGPRCCRPLPNDALAAAAAGNADVFTTSDTPDDETGGFGLDFEPLGWSAAETGGASVLGRAGGGNAMLYVTAAGVWELDLDGTTIITTTATPADGVSQRLDVRWASGGLMTLAVDGIVWSAAYDGTVQNAGAWELELDGGEAAIRNFYVVRNGSG